MEKKSVAVLGLGQFGRSLAESLYELGMDVLVADQDLRTNPPLPSAAISPRRMKSRPSASTTWTSSSSP